MIGLVFLLALGIALAIGAHWEGGKPGPGPFDDPRSYDHREEM